MEVEVGSETCWRCNGGQQFLSGQKIPAVSRREGKGDWSVHGQNDVHQVDLRKSLGKCSDHHAQND